MLYQLEHAQETQRNFIHPISNRIFHHIDANPIIFASSTSMENTVEITSHHSITVTS